jgi:hypothetical protein
MIDRGPNVTAERAFAMNVLFSLPRADHIYTIENVNVMQNVKKKTLYIL